MSRFLIAFFTIFFFSTPAFCQEQDSQLLRSEQDSLSLHTQQDSQLLRSEHDSLSLHSQQDSLTAPPKRKPVLIKPGTGIARTDTTGVLVDTTQSGEIAEYVPLFESDTVYEMQGSDTIPYYRTAPRAMGDTAYVQPDFSHSPSRATMLSLVLPGLGQAYNKKYFKVPIVWAAIGGAGYAISYNTKLYRKYSNEYILNPDDLGERYLRLSRRWMELSYISLIAVYALQVVDAYVDAQLYSWDVSENLSMGISPSLQPLMVPGSLTGQSYGLTCSFNLRKK